LARVGHDNGARARGYPNLAKATGSRELLRQPGGHSALRERKRVCVGTILDTEMLTVKRDTIGRWFRRRDWDWDTGWWSQE
jgi:hypothetical protein